MGELLKWLYSIMKTTAASNLVTLGVSLVAGLLLLFIEYYYIIPGSYIKRALGREEPAKAESYSERLASLMKSLTKASSEVDNILAELGQVAEDRAKTVQKIETELAELEEQEKQLQRRIQDLRELPIPVAEHFAAMVAPGERRSAWRDYTLFAVGVVVSTVIAILLRLAGLG